MRAKSTAKYLILTLVLLTVAALVYAGPTGKIEGTITDAETGDPVVGASVMVVGTKLGAVTDSAGKFVIDQLEPGTYTLKVTHLDYGPLTMQAITVNADAATDASCRLTKKQPSEQG
ncbi:MAG: carboxypeptidase-like regulatory domain-containing protein, partial [Candidatus Zixiibacteriota bacterium]